MLLPFAKLVTSVELTGVTNDRTDRFVIFGLLFWVFIFDVRCWVYLSSSVRYISFDTLHISSMHALVPFLIVFFSIFLFCPFIHPFIYLFVYLFLHFFVSSFIHFFISSFIHLFSHSFIYFRSVDLIRTVTLPTLSTLFSLPVDGLQLKVPLISIPLLSFPPLTPSLLSLFFSPSQFLFLSLSLSLSLSLFLSLSLSLSFSFIRSKKGELLLLVVVW